MSDDTKHFEHLWERAEEVSATQYPIKNELFNKLKQDIDDYLKLEDIPSNDIKSTLKTKKMGEILFKLATLSKLDNVNTYAALQLEVVMLEKISQ